MKKSLQIFLILFLLLFMQSIFIVNFGFSTSITIYDDIGNYIYIAILIIEILLIWKNVVSNKNLKKYLLILPYIFIVILITKLNVGGTIVSQDLLLTISILQIDAIVLIIFIILKDNINKIKQISNKWLTLLIIIMFMLAIGANLGMILQNEVILIVLFNVVITFYSTIKINQLLPKNKFNWSTVIIILFILLFSIYNIIQYNKLSKANNILKECYKEMEYEHLQLDELNIRLSEYEEKLRPLGSSKSLFIYNQIIESCTKGIELHNDTIVSRMTYNLYNTKIKIDTETLQFFDSMSQNMNVFNKQINKIKYCILINMTGTYILILVIYKSNKSKEKSYE